MPGWGLEITLDVEWVHAMAPGANIDLVEASNSSLPNLPIASNSAATILGVSVVSQSWAYYLEYEGQSSEEQALNATYYAPALATNPNVTFLAATGDGSANYGPTFPSVSPLNVGVGGTTLNINGDSYVSESAWSGRRRSQRHLYVTFLPTGVSGYGFGALTMRTVPDISAVADPSTGVSVYDPVDYGGWVSVGGTSVATPITAGTIAIADEGRVLLGGHSLSGPEQTLPGIYAAYNSANAYTPDLGFFRDVTSGNNGFPAGPGYDLATGVGSEQAENWLPFLRFTTWARPSFRAYLASGQVVTTTPPTDFSLTFNEPIEPGWSSPVTLPSTELRPIRSR